MIALPASAVGDQDDEKQSCTVKIHDA
jgi:hypothetical protein